MKNAFKTIFGILLLLSFSFAWAQPPHPVKWTYTAKKTAPNEYELTFSASVEEPWHIYTQFLEPNGPVPTAFHFKEDGYKLDGKAKEVGNPTKVWDEGFKMNITYYSKKVDYVQKIHLTKPISKIKGTLEYMVCNDEMCLPPEEEPFTFNVEFDKNAPKTGDEKTPLENDKGKGEISPPAGSPSSEVEPSSGSPAGIFKPAPGAETGPVLHAVDWKYETRSKGSDKYELRFIADIDDGWHIYGLEKRKEGPTATSFLFNDNPNVRLLGSIREENPVESKYDSVFGMNVVEYRKKAVFVQDIQLIHPVSEITGKLTYMACDDRQCLTPEDVDFKFEMKEETLSSGTDESLGSIFGKGFLGGLIALVTPCVFPMIPLTVSFFTKKDQKVKSIFNAILFGVSIIVIYVGLGFIVSRLFGADTLNSMASNVYFNLAFFIIFVVFAFSFFGAFEISLPSSWANKADRKSEKGGLIGIFFVAFTLALVSFSCTGPIIGNLLVLAAVGGGNTGPITGMFGFALALALPFTLFAIFPSLMQSLPKSGGWLNAVKVSLGFIELALALKFFSNADLAYHWNILKREYFIALWIIIFGMLGFYLLGKLKFSHDSLVDYVSLPRLLFAIMSFAFTAYMVPGLWGAPLKMLSGLAPPIQYSEWNNGGTRYSVGMTNASNVIEPRKYSDLFECPHGLNCYFDYDEGMKAAKKAGKPVMIDFTGHSCVNCRKMEDNVWVDPEVLRRLNEDYVLISLYVDDKTDLPSNEVYTSKFSGKEINTLGRKWADFEATHFNKVSQPYYVLLDHNEQELTEPHAYDPSIESFINFLDSGKKEFQNRMKITVR